MSNCAGAFHIGLNKGEAQNALARAVFFNRLGELRDRTSEKPATLGRSLKSGHGCNRTLEHGLHGAGLLKLSATKGR
jgi:hypothetical protein